MPQKRNKEQRCKTKTQIKKIQRITKIQNKKRGQQEKEFKRFWSSLRLPCFLMLAGPLPSRNQDNLILWKSLKPLTMRDFKLYNFYIFYMFFDQLTILGGKCKARFTSDEYQLIFSPLFHEKMSHNISLFKYSIC